MDLFDLFYEQKELAKDIMFGPYQLMDLTQIEDDEFKNCLWSDIVIKSMKHIWENDIIPFLNDILKDLQTIEEKGEISYISRILEYIIEAGTIKDKEEFKKVIKLGFSRKTGEEIMTIAEMFRQDGIAEGEARGETRGEARGETRAAKSIALRLLKDGVDKTKTAKITGLSKKEIDEIG